MNQRLSSRVSIVVPLYNNAEHLTECIESVVAQTHQNWDCTIVNNCSTDGDVDPTFQALFSENVLTPTILAFALVNPFGWIMFANGRVGRSLKIALMIAPLTILTCVLGFGYGLTGVATGFSTAMVLLVMPIVLLAKQDVDYRSGPSRLSSPRPHLPQSGSPWLSLHGPR